MAGLKLFDVVGRHLRFGPTAIDEAKHQAWLSKLDGNRDRAVDGKPDAEIVEAVFYGHALSLNTTVVVFPFECASRMEWAGRIPVACTIV